jgi:hypothetical protein
VCWRPCVPRVVTAPTHVRRRRSPRIWHRRVARSRMPQVMRPAVSLAHAVVRPVLLREVRQIVEQNGPMCGVPTLRLWSFPQRCARERRCLRSASGKQSLAAPRADHRAVAWHHAALGTAQLRLQAHPAGDGSAASAEPLTLNQRVQGSSPCAPTNHFKDLAQFRFVISTKRQPLISTNSPLSFSLRGVSVPRLFAAASSLLCIEQSWRKSCDHSKRGFVHRLGRHCRSQCCRHGEVP